MSCVAQRSRRDRFTAWEGVSDSEPLQRTLAERFGVDHLWSASQLEHYAACPYQFFAEHVLKLAPAPELALQSDMLRRGQLLHSALERLYRDHGAELAALPLDDKLDPQAAETLLERFREMLHASARSPRSRGLDAALRHIERRQIESWGRAFAQQHAAYRKGFRVEGQPLQPTYFEARFGPGSRKSSSAGDAGLSSFEPYRLALPQETIRVTGQIDRIDVAQVGDKTVFNVIDYKASQAKKVVLEKVACGLQLQLAIYALAVQELLLAEKQAQPLSAGYWSVRGSGYGNSAKSPQVLVMNRVVEGRIEPAADWLKLRGEMLASIERIIGGIRGGQFAVFNADKECTKFCSYSKICRIAQVRSLEKSWPLS